MTKDEDEETRQDVKKMVGRMKEDEEDERVRVAPNMELGGSHSQATSDPEEGEKRETRRMRWADREDEEGKEEEELETEGERKEETEGEKKAKAAVDQRVEKLEKMPAWQMTKVRKK